MLQETYTTPEGVQLYAVPMPHGCETCYFLKEGNCTKPENDWTKNPCSPLTRIDGRNIVWRERVQNWSECDETKGMAGSVALVAKAVERNSCKGCYFAEDNGGRCTKRAVLPLTFPCLNVTRRDGKNVIWVRAATKETKK